MRAGAYQQLGEFQERRWKVRKNEEFQGAGFIVEVERTSSSPADDHPPLSRNAPNSGSGGDMFAKASTNHAAWILANNQAMRLLLELFCKAGDVMTC